METYHLPWEADQSGALPTIAVQVSEGDGRSAKKGSDATWDKQRKSFQGRVIARRVTSPTQEPCRKKCV